MKNLILFALLVLIFASCEKQHEYNVVKYQIESTKGVKLEYLDPFGNTFIDSTEKSVYKALFEVESINQLIFIKAKSENQFNSVICRIYIDEKIVKQSTLYGIGETNCYYYLDFLEK